MAKQSKKNGGLFGIIAGIFALAGVSAGIIYLKNNSDSIPFKNNVSNSDGNDNSQTENGNGSIIESDLKINLYDESFNKTTGVLTFEYVYNVINTNSKKLTYSLESRFADCIEIRIETQYQNIYVDVTQPFSGDATIPFTTDTLVTRSITINLNSYAISQLFPESPSIEF